MNKKIKTYILSVAAVICIGVGIFVLVNRGGSAEKENNVVTAQAIGKSETTKQDDLKEEDTTPESPAASETQAAVKEGDVQESTDKASSNSNTNAAINSTAVKETAKQNTSNASTNSKDSSSVSTSSKSQTNNTTASATTTNNTANTNVEEDTSFENAVKEANAEIEKQMKEEEERMKKEAEEEAEKAAEEAEAARKKAEEEANKPAQKIGTATVGSAPAINKYYNYSFQSSIEQAFLTKMNAVRKQNGLPDLTWDNSLMNTSRYSSLQMSQTLDVKGVEYSEMNITSTGQKYFGVDFTAPYASRRNYSVQMGQSMNSSVVDDFTTLKQRVKNPNVTKIGAGVVYTPDNKGYFFVTVFIN